MKNKKKVVAIIQARMGSSRLPCKVLMHIGSKTILGILLHRVSQSNRLDDVVVATTLENSDDVLSEWLEKNNQKYFRGNATDVLDRYWNCAKIHNADIIVRITGDDPLKDPELIDQCVEIFLSNPDLDYLSNNIKPSYPEGLDVEVFSFETLNRAYREANLPSEREHVTPYIWKNRELFKLHSVEGPTNESHHRWTVDHPVDVVYITKVLEKFGYDYDVKYRDILDMLSQEPEIRKINEKINRKEGYFISLKNDIKS